VQAVFPDIYMRRLGDREPKTWSMVFEQRGLELQAGNISPVAKDFCWLFLEPPFETQTSGPLRSIESKFEDFEDEITFIPTGKIPVVSLELAADPLTSKWRRKDA